MQIYAEYQRGLCDEKMMQPTRLEKTPNQKVTIVGCPAPGPAKTNALGGWACLQSGFPIVITCDCNVHPLNGLTINDISISSHVTHLFSRHLNHQQLIWTNYETVHKPEKVKFSYDDDDNDDDDSDDSDDDLPPSIQDLCG